MSKVVRRKKDGLGDSSTATSSYGNERSEKELSETRREALACLIAEAASCTLVESRPPSCMQTWPGYSLVGS